MKYRSILKKTVTATRQVRGQRALAQLQRDAAGRGLSTMTCEEIEAEIRAARAARR